MDEGCCLCGIEIFELAHVEARRFFEATTNDRIQNIIPLCPTCHTLFDLGYITIHPEYRIFVFSMKRHRKNLLRKFRYAHSRYPILDCIPRYHIERQFKEEFEKAYGENELKMRFLDNPSETRHISMNYQLA